jgi:hypothetical protein
MMLAILCSRDSLVLGFLTSCICALPSCLSGHGTCHNYSFILVPVGLALVTHYRDGPPSVPAASAKLAAAVKAVL